MTRLLTLGTSKPFEDVDSMESDVDIARFDSAVPLSTKSPLCLYVYDAQQARHLRGHPTCLVPSSGRKIGTVMHSADVPHLLSLRLCLVVGQLSAVFGCILDVSSFLDDFTKWSCLQRHPGSRAHEFNTYVRVHECLTASSSFDDSFNVVDGTRENDKSVYQRWFSTEF